MRMKILCRIPLLFTQYAGKTIMAQHKSKKTKSKFPSSFVQMMYGWSKYLKSEMEAHEELMSGVIASGTDDAITSGFAIGPLNYLDSQYDPVNMKTTVQFEVINPNPNVRNIFSKRSPVAICPFGSIVIGKCGVVSRNTVNEIEIRLRGRNDISPGQYLIRPLVSAGTVESALNYINGSINPDMRSKNVIDMTFRATLVPSIHHDATVTPSQKLNESQTRALAAALNAKRLFICIEGPPGTGKTKVVSEIIVQCVRKKKRILVVSPTHAALAEIMDRLSILCTNNEWLYIEDLDARITEEAMNNGMENNDTHVHMPYAMKWKLTKEVLAKSYVILSTATSSLIRDLNHFDWRSDLLLVDEAGQLPEPSTWIAAAHTTRIVLAGDPKQLPPVFIAKGNNRQIVDEAKEKYRSLLERLMTEFSSYNSNFLLDEQFRMNEEIMAWSNEQFYGGRLTAHPFVAKQRLSDLCPNLEPQFNSPMLFFNSDGIQGRREEIVHQSFRNRKEALLIRDYISKLLQHGLPPDCIGVISPYFAQTAYIRLLLKDLVGIVVDTVDAFQGKQKEVILFSTVRDNYKEKFGFVTDPRRMNVAVTRARRQFALFGSERMVQSDPLLTSLRKNLVQVSLGANDSKKVRIKTEKNL